MDAKQSPLALLALTCNSIGKEVSSKPSPPLSQSTDKKDTPKDSKDVSKNAQKLKDGNLRPDSKERSDVSLTKSSSLNKVSSSHKSAVSPSKASRDNHVLATSSRSGQSSSSGRERSRSPIDRRSTSPVSRPTSSTNHHQKRANSGGCELPDSYPAKVSRIGEDGNRKTSNISPYPSRPKSQQRAPSPFSSAAAAALASGLRSEHGALGSAAAAAAAAAAGLSPFGYYPFGSHQLALDAALYAASLSGRYSPGKSALPPPPPPSAHSLGGASPFVSYATVKTASGSSTLVPVCKDPYCAQCQVAIRAAQLMPPSTCPPGCVQCTEKILAYASGGLSASAAAAGVYSTSPHHSSSATSFPSSVFHGHAFSPLGSASSHGGSSSGVHPFVCSWVLGGEYCGKKFASSEELLAHLRTHTSSSSAESLHHSPITPPSLTGFPSLPLGLMSSYAQLQSAYSALAQDSLRQPAYPRSLSPASLLSSASRFNPYKLPSLLPPSVSGSGMLGNSSSLPPSLSSLYAPYLSLYGQRLGVIP